MCIIRRMSIKMSHRNLQKRGGETRRSNSNFIIRNSNTRLRDFVLARMESFKCDAPWPWERRSRTPDNSCAFFSRARRRWPISCTDTRNVDTWISALDRTRRSDVGSTSISGCRHRHSSDTGTSSYSYCLYRFDSTFGTIVCHSFGLGRLRYQRWPRKRWTGQ